MNQLCKVCAEPAAGFHFGAFTCEGCKSFFGRTYNNLSQIHECKNGGQCVINKQNRTSCKACRLRKCLVVGMSKTGSRYGRRSNWFKIHCLLQEQCGYSSSAGQFTSFRSPVTPTLQDGSLPFVNTQLRDALRMEAPLTPADHSISPTARIPITSSGSGVCIRTPVSEELVTSAAAMSEQRSPHSFGVGQMGAVERRIKEETLNAIRRGVGMPDSELEATYREQLFEAIRRSHNLQPPRLLDTNAVQSMMRPTPECDPVRRIEVKFERVRRASSESENRINSGNGYDWDRRLQDTPVFSECLPLKSTSPHSSKDLLSVSVGQNTECSTTCSQIKREIIANEIDSVHKVVSDGTSERSSDNRSPVCHTPKSQKNSRLSEDSGTPMTEEERLSFLKSTSKISANIPVSREGSVINSFHGIPGLFPHRPPRDDILYTPLNNNIFPFPSYPPVWPSILPFPSLAKFYPPYNSPPVSSTHLSLDPFKNPVFMPSEMRNSLLPNPLHDAIKGDSSNKKRILDAILQVQRESSCGPMASLGGLSPTAVTLAMSLPQHVTTSVLSSATSVSTTSTSSGEQPIDLTVRRKRKMAKRDITYQPHEEERHQGIKDDFHRGIGEREDDKDETRGKIDEDDDADEEPLDERAKREILVKGTSEIVDLKTSIECATRLPDAKFEVPLKIMKLETAGDGLIT
ncbi:uncharacterized protein LOC108667670 isoform X2 [Hyalella azteca]|uniref:Uncharacterized protein LOC108667670 isoform X2 n=1 Tax=Hyalella azteca TaxID=294128 RepID=A0A8B7N9P9_HYAAZ|nr:uncharacterized protein LOC108667670 isoform X2 [Hyalella azteca]